MAKKANSTLVPARERSLKEQFLRDVTRPGQSQAMADTLTLIASMDDMTFEAVALPFLAAQWREGGYAAA